MRILLAAIALLFAVQSVGQTRVEFREVSWDFGLIPEKGGKVSHHFWYVNTGKKPVQVVDAEVSCGCTIPIWQVEKVQPGDSAFVQLDYDPDGRPGEFSKPVTVWFDSEGDRFPRYLNINGWTISDDHMDSLGNFMKPNEEEMSIRFAPARFLDGQPMDSLLKSKRFNRFMNDLTYVLDKDYLANVEILFISDRLINLQYVNALKEGITKGLTDRGYEAYQAGISDRRIPPNAGELMGEKGDQILLMVPTYHDQFLEKTIVKYAGEDMPKPTERKEQPTMITRKGTQFGARVSDNSWFYEETAYQRFLRTVSYDILEDGEVEIQLHLRRRLESEKEAAKTLKKAGKLTSKIKAMVEKDLEERGITEGALTWVQDSIDIRQLLDTPEPITKFDDYLELYLVYTEPVPFTTPDTNPDPASDGFTESQDPVAILPDSVEEAVVVAGDGMAERVKLFPKQTLPVYQRHFLQDDWQIDTTDKHFREIMDQVMASIKKEQWVQFLVESSASKSPTLNRYNNQFVSRQRARETQATIRKYLLDHGVKPEHIEFLDPVCLVQGPIYVREFFEPEFYEQFEYMKVIPLFKSPFDVKRDIKLTPYMITFDYNDSDLSEESPVFRKFVKKLVPFIEKQGYVELVIESSASKVPSSKGTPNDIIAYFRAYYARQTLVKALSKHGVDPNRLIVTQERPLVLGPDYEGKSEVNREMYSRFQYIKIIPAAMLEN